MSQDNSPQKVFIYGSCVARDTCEYLPENYRVMTYVARHSLLSDGSDALYMLPNQLGLANAFQTRSLRADWQGNPLTPLRENPNSYDIILWDIFDERHGVHWFATGQVVTRSIDLVSSAPAMDLIAPGTHVPFGTDDHFDAWADKATELVTLLKNTGALPNVCVLNVPWAEKNTLGEPTPVSMGISATQANQLTQRYYRHLENLGVPTITVPAELAIADPNHQWGHAPFHYIPATYQYIRDALTNPA